MNQTDPTDILIEQALIWAAQWEVAPRANRRAWTAEEEAYLRKHAGLITDAEIATHINRTETSVKIRRVRLMLPARGSHPAFLSASRAANLLGMDEHKVTGWIDTGLLPGEIYTKQNATGRCAAGLYMRRVRWVTLRRWLTRPNNWPRFRAHKIADPALRSLVLRAQARWGDEWWTTAQVAAYHGVSMRWVITKITRGEIPALRMPNFGGRTPTAQAWAFNFVKKSDAVQAIFLEGKGSAQARRAEKYTWSAGADAWIVKAHTAGMPWTEIAARMRSRRGYHWRATKVAYRYKMLLEREATL